MAVSVFKNALIVVSDYNVSGQSNSVALEYGADTPEATVFGDGTHNMASSLFTAKANVSGFHNVAVAPTRGVDPTLYNFPGPVPITIAPDNTDQGAAYMMNGITNQFRFGGKVGDLLPFDYSASVAANSSGQGGFLTRGSLFAPLTSRSSTANGTGIQFAAALSSTQKLIANLHVTAYSGLTNVIFVIESDDNGGFTTPTTRITFTTVTGLTSEYKELAGPIATDDRYRVKWTISGAGSFSAVVACGVQSFI